MVLMLRQLLVLVSIVVAMPHMANCVSVCVCECVSVLYLGVL